MATSHTTTNSAKAWAPDVSTFAAADVVPDALIMQTSTVLGSVEGDAPLVRVGYVDDAAVQITAEGEVIPEAEPELAEVTVATSKVTQMLRVSREQYFQPATAGELSASVQRAVTNFANEIYLKQPAPTAPAVAPAAGLLNVAGIVNGGAVDTDLDALIDLVASLEGNKAQPTHILLDPVGWASLRKIRTADGWNTNLLGAGTSDAQRMLLDLPVIVSSAMPASTGLVVDKSAIVSAVGKVQLAVSEDAYFASDSVALRCTWRFGQNLVKPDRIGKFTVGSAA